MEVVVLQEVVASTAARGEYGLLTQLDTFWQTCPYTVAALVCGGKASLADFVAQHQQFTTTSSAMDDAQETLAAAVAVPKSTSSTIRDDGTSAQLDLKRNLAFVIYGALYQGILRTNTSLIIVIPFGLEPAMKRPSWPPRWLLI